VSAGTLWVGWNGGFFLVDDGMCWMVSRVRGVEMSVGLRVRGVDVLS
jgi:hypothetical protein